MSSTLSPPGEQEILASVALAAVLRALDAREGEGGAAGGADEDTQADVDAILALAEPDALRELVREFSAVELSALVLDADSLPVPTPVLVPEPEPDRPCHRPEDLFFLACRLLSCGDTDSVNTQRLPDGSLLIQVCLAPTDPEFVRWCGLKESVRPLPSPHAANGHMTPVPAAAPAAVAVPTPPLFSLATDVEGDGGEGEEDAGAGGLARFYASLWNATVAGGGEVGNDEVARAGEELEGSGWEVHEDADTGEWEAVQVGQDGEGATLGWYLAGEPDADPWEEYVPRSGKWAGKTVWRNRMTKQVRYQEKKPGASRRVAKAPEAGGAKEPRKPAAPKEALARDDRALAEKLREHARELEPQEAKTAARSFAALKRLHGEKVLDRVGELADRALTALGKLKDGDPRAEKLRGELARLASFAIGEAKAQKGVAPEAPAPAPSPEEEGIDLTEPADAPGGGAEPDGEGLDLTEPGEGAPEAGAETTEALVGRVVDAYDRAPSGYARREAALKALQGMSPADRARVLDDLGVDEEHPGALDDRLAWKVLDRQGMGGQTLPSGAAEAPAAEEQGGLDLPEPATEAPVAGEGEEPPGLPGGQPAEAKPLPEDPAERAAALMADGGSYARSQFRAFYEQLRASDPETIRRVAKRLDIPLGDLYGGAGIRGAKAVRWAATAIANHMAGAYRRASAGAAPPPRPERGAGFRDWQQRAAQAFDAGEEGGEEGEAPAPGEGPLPIRDEREERVLAHQRRMEEAGQAGEGEGEEAPEEAPAAPAPSGQLGRKPAPAGKPAPHRDILSAFRRLDAEDGYNLVSLVDLARETGLSIPELHDAVQDLRHAGVLTASSAEMREGITPEEQRHSIREDGNQLLFMSIKNPDRAEEVERGGTVPPRPGKRQPGAAPAPSGQTGQKGGPALASLPLFDFAREVQAIADATGTGGFGEDKVMIAHVYREAARRHPGLTPEGFKARLVEAGRQGLLRLSRADLVQAMDPDDVRDSAAGAGGGAEFHLIGSRNPTRAQTRAAEQPAPEAAAPAGGDRARRVASGLARPHEHTLAEWRAAHQYDRMGPRQRRDIDAEHRRRVEEYAAEPGEVPPEVLADYPDLAPSGPTGQKPAAPGKPAVDADAIVQEAEALYEGAVEQASLRDRVEALGRNLAGLGKSDLVRAATGLGMVGMHTRPKPQIIKEITDRILARKGATQRASMIERGPGRRPAPNSEGARMLRRLIEDAGWDFDPLSHNFATAPLEEMRADLLPAIGAEWRRRKRSDLDTSALEWLEGQLRGAGPGPGSGVSVRPAVPPQDALRDAYAQLRQLPAYQHGNIGMGELYREMAKRGPVTKDQFHDLVRDLIRSGQASISMANAPARIPDRDLGIWDGDTLLYYLTLKGQGGGAR